MCNLYAAAVAVLFFFQLLFCFTNCFGDCYCVVILVNEYFSIRIVFEPALWTAYHVPSYLSFRSPLAIFVRSLVGG